MVTVKCNNCNKETTTKDFYHSLSRKCNCSKNKYKIWDIYWINKIVWTYNAVHIIECILCWRRISTKSIKNYNSCVCTQKVLHIWKVYNWKLLYKLVDKTYYFECIDCKATTKVNWTQWSKKKCRCKRETLLMIWDRVMWRTVVWKTRYHYEMQCDKCHAYALMTARHPRWCKCSIKENKLLYKK